MTALWVTLALVATVALLLRWQRPAWYWMSFGILFAVVRVLVRYSSVMDACGLTVPPRAGGSLWPVWPGVPSPTHGYRGS